MALIKFSALVSDMRNKLNGSVLAKNKGGNYMRNKTTPVNPQSAAQLAKRAVFGALSAGFRALGGDNITAWNNAAGDFPYFDIFGDSRTLSGSQLYVKLNNNLSQVGASPLTFPPMPAGTGAVQLAVVEFDTGDTEINITQDLISPPAGYGFIYEATRPLSAGVRFYKNEFRQILTTATSTPATPTALWNAYVTKFGLPEAPANIGFRVSIVNTATGERSVASSIKALVV